jgi:LCP family protein required for cell wall assembly
MEKVQLSKWLQKAVGIALAASYIFAVYLVIDTNMVPTKYLVFAVPVSFLVVVLLVIANFKTKKLSRNKKIGIIIVSLIMIVANMYVFSISNNTMSLLNNIQDDGYTYEQYSIIAKTDRHIKLTSSIQQHMGIIKTDVNNDLVKNEVNKKTKVGYTNYDELTSITVALNNKSVNMAVINNSYIQLLKENDSTFYRGIEVLSTFTVKVKKDVNITKVDITKPFTMYISGIDTYGDISTVSRSDVNIMVVINPQTHKILLVNTPRDYYVQLHGTTGLKDKLTHSGIYGVDMSVKTMEDLYGVPINYYLRINFSSLTKIIDMLGGVDVNSEYKFTADGYSFNVGINHLSGSQALAFSRERHSFEGGDRTRGSNQELVIEAIIAKMNDPQTIINYQQILSSLSGVIQTNMSPSDISKIISAQLNDMSKWSVKSISVAGTDSHNYTYSMGNMSLYVMVPDMATVNIAKQEIQQYLQS